MLIRNRYFREIYVGVNVTNAEIAGTCLNLEGNNIDMKSYNCNQASCNPDFSYPLVSSISFSFSSPISLSHPQLCHDRRIQYSVISLWYLYTP